MDDTLEIWEYLDKILGCYIKKIKLRLEKDGLTITDYKIIYLLTKGQQPMKNIAGELSLANGWVTDIVDRLERKNLLLRKHDMNDRRIVNVELTKEGRNYYEELGLFIKNIISESLKNLNKDEIENFKLILNKISDAIGTELLKAIRLTLYINLPYVDMHLLYRENLARIAKFHTKHGDIETPTVLPVINPNLNFLSESELRSLGAQAVITNSYIIRRTDSLRENALKYGVHKLIGFNGPIMTDSGTFQSYVYGDIEYTNKEIVDFQKKIGSDIITILDIFTRPEDKYEESKHAVEETYRRLQEIDIGDDIIAGPIQGSVYPDLRSLSAQLMSRAPYLPIGGVVPLLESYRYDDLVKIIINSK